ncbi:mitochondrial outer membrane protein porin of 36 kDa, partial [Tanacetum coccineum]
MVNDTTHVHNSKPGTYREWMRLLYVMDATPGQSTTQNLGMASAQIEDILLKVIKSTRVKDKVALGTDFSFNATSGNFTKYNAALSFSTTDLIACLILIDKAYTFAASYYHTVSPLTNTAVGVELAGKASEQEHMDYLHHPNFVAFYRVVLDGLGGSVATYKHTLDLPKTTFGMRANSSIREPELQKLWDENQVFKKVAENITGSDETHHNWYQCSEISLESLSSKYRQKFTEEAGIFSGCYVIGDGNPAGIGLYLVVDEKEQFREDNFLMLQDTFTKQKQMGGNQSRNSKS